MTETRQAACSCGAVRIEVQGAPVSEGFCHCASCRAFTAQPVTAYALWPRERVAIVAGADRLGASPRNGATTNRFCTLCGGNLMIELRGGAMFDVFPMIVAGHEFRPAAHINYAERVLDMPDGLPKFRDMPERAGGSGELVAE